MSKMIDDAVMAMSPHAAEFWQVAVEAGANNVQGETEIGQRPTSTLAIGGGEEEERASKIAKSVTDAIQSLGESNQLAIQLQSFQVALVDPGPGWEAERMRIQAEAMQNAQSSADYQLMASRIGQEAALQVDTVRKSNAILEAQVQYLLGVIQRQHSNITAQAQEAQRIEVAYRNQMHLVLGKASELYKLYSASQHRYEESIFVLNQKDAKMQELSTLIQQLRQSEYDTVGKAEAQKQEIGHMSVKIQDLKNQINDLQASYDTLEIERDELMVRAAESANVKMQANRRLRLRDSPRNSILAHLLLVSLLLSLVFLVSLVGFSKMVGVPRRSGISCRCAVMQMFSTQLSLMSRHRRIL